MDEKQWLTTTMPVPMLLHLVETASERKWRLLICACLRAVWSDLPEKLFRAAASLAEDLADGHASRRTLLAVRRNLSLAAIHARHRNAIDEAQWADLCRLAVSESPFDQPLRLPPLDEGERFYVEITDEGALTRDPRQCHVIRELFGNPFRQRELDDYVLTGHSSAVADLAAKIYEERCFDLMPVLADALEDAGCDDDEMLAHCREHPEHFRGCWVLDAILDKEAALR